MDEVFGEENFVVLITFQKTGGIEGKYLMNTSDFILWFARSRANGKFRRLKLSRRAGHTSLDRYDQYQPTEFSSRPLTRAEKAGDELIDVARRFQLFPLYSEGASEGASRKHAFQGTAFRIRSGTHWKTTESGLERIFKADRMKGTGRTIRYKRFAGDVPMLPLTDRWESTQIGTERVYIVQTSVEVIKRCILMATDPGDLVLDPTCGAGTTAFVAEQWGRRWITIDSSRVALALARARVMGARYPYYVLADSREGQQKEAEITRTAPKQTGTYGRLRQGFVYERVPHVTLRAIANNAEIDIIWERLQLAVESALGRLNQVLVGHREPLVVTVGGRKGATIDFRSPPGTTVSLPSGKEAPASGFLEWEVPREAPSDWPSAAPGHCRNSGRLASRGRRRSMRRSLPKPSSSTSTTSPTKTRPRFA